MADPASAERLVLRVCRSGLDVTDLQHQLLAALRAAMTIEAAFFATADPETLLFTGAHSEDPLIALAPIFLDNELDGQDVNTFTGLVRSPATSVPCQTTTLTRGAGLAGAGARQFVVLLDAYRTKPEITAADGK